MSILLTGNVPDSVSVIITSEVQPQCSSEPVKHSLLLVPEVTEGESSSSSSTEAAERGRMSSTNQPTGSN